MKKALSILLIILTLALILTGCQSASKKYELGVEAMKNKDWDEAITYFSDLNYNDSADLLKECEKEKGMTEKSDYKFLETLSTALMERYKKSKADEGLKTCVNYEYEMLKEFESAEFYDSELESLAHNYIDGIKLEINSLSADDGSQQLVKEEGTLKRFQTLKSLTDKYGLLKDNAEYRSEYYNEVENKEFEFNALKAIENDIGNQFKKLVADYVDDVTARIVLKNNTDYEYDMYMHFVFYDKKGTIIETTEEYYENIKSKKKYNLDFYFPEKAESFDWYTEEYNIKN